MTAVTDVPLTRLDNADPQLLQELLAAVERVAQKSAFTLGTEVEAFESEFAAYCGSAHAIGVSSGTEALVLALRALSIGPGDEVLVPANSFIATAEAVSLVGGTPRFLDVDPDTALITVEGVEAAIGPRTRCVIPVHLYGRTVEIDPIVEIARRHDAAVIEDACQAHGAFYEDGRRAGSVGDAGCFSFYPAKNLGAWGDGGAVTTNDQGVAERIRVLRSHGEQRRYHHETIGTTARLDAIQAAILRIKLRRLDEWNQRRREIGTRLARALRHTSVTVPAPAHAAGDHVYHQFVVQSGERDLLREHLAASGISTAIHYPVPIHLTPAYAALGRPHLPICEALADQILSLPMFPTMTSDELDRVVAGVQSFAEGPAGSSAVLAASHRQ